MFFDEMKIGMAVDIPPAVIEKDKMLSFAKDYDNIPLHTDEEYAKNTGGLCPECYVRAMAAAKLFPPGAAQRSSRREFSRGFRRETAICEALS